LKLQGSLKFQRSKFYMQGSFSEVSRKKFSFLKVSGKLPSSFRDASSCRQAS
jgi:hypothetical protein